MRHRPGSKPGSARKTIWQTFRAPLLIAFLSLIGLVCALVVDGAADQLANMLVAAPLLAFLWLRRNRT